MNLTQDVRYGSRIFTRAPGPAIVIVLSLALAIGANTAVFSFVNAIQFKPLPFEDEDSLVDISETSVTELCAGCGVGASYPVFLEWKAQAQSFTAMGAYQETSFVLSTGGDDRAVVSGDPEPQRVSGAIVSGDFFRLLGVQPALGREIGTDDDRIGAAPVVVLSEMVWRRRFGANPAVLGTSVKVNGVTRTVIGVMPQRFSFPEFAQLWVPLAPSMERATRGSRSLGVIGRLRDGTDAETARAEMRTIAAGLEARYPEQRRWSADVVSLREDMTGETAMASTVLLSAVGFVLLIAAANVANLLLARAATRRREIAIRFALGAGRARVARLVLAESLLLAAAGGLAGFLTALWGARAILLAFESQVPYWIRFGMDWRVLAFSLAITVVTGVLCGAVPAIAVARGDLHTTLKQGGSVAGACGGRRFRQGLVVAQLSLALLLLAGAGLTIKTLVRTSTFDIGYDPSRVLVGDVALVGPRYEDRAQVGVFVRAVLEQLERIPGARPAISRSVFFRGFGGRERVVSVEGLTAVPPGASPGFYDAVTPGYFAAIGVPLRAGRAFTDADAGGVVIINETMAGRLWRSEGALGHRIRFGGTDPADAPVVTPWLTIVGVVADIGGSPFAREDPKPPYAYVPFPSSPGSTFAITVGTDSDPTTLAREIRAAVRAADPDQVLEDLQSMEQALRTWVAPARFIAMLLSGLAAIALLLASMGTYGVIAYAVNQRQREIGIRLALGATTRQVQALMARSGAAMAAVGLALGLPAAWVSTRALEGILAGTSPTDPVVFASVALVLALVAMAASWLPARRASRVDPVVVLRVE